MVEATTREALGATAEDIAATTASSSSVSLGDLSLRFQSPNENRGIPKATTPLGIQAAGSATTISPIRDSGLQLVSSDGTPGGNQRQNAQVDKVVQILGLSKKQRRELHDEISGKNYSFLEILEEAKTMFNK